MCTQSIDGNNNILIKGNNNTVYINNFENELKSLTQIVKDLQKLAYKDNKMGLDKELAKKLKENVAVYDSGSKKDKTPKKEYEIIDFAPSAIFFPKKYYTAQMNLSCHVSYLNEGDIIIIDPAIKKVYESGIYVFEYKGCVMVRQFCLLPFGTENTKDELHYKSVGTWTEEIYPHDKVTIIGAVISKQTELFLGLYYNNPMRRAYGTKEYSVK